MWFGDVIVIKIRHHATSQHILDFLTLTLMMDSYSLASVLEADDILESLFVCLFVLLLYVPSQQLWSWREGQFI